MKVSFFNYSHFSTTRPLSRALNFGGFTVCLRVIRKAGLRGSVTLIKPAESQCLRFFLVTVPETNQHEEQKARSRKAAECKQNTAEHSCQSIFHWSPENVQSSTCSCRHSRP